MSASSRPSCCLWGRACLVACGAVCAAAALVAAHQPPVENAEQAVFHCGKARALAQRYLTEDMRADWREEYERMLAAGLREASSDTDLLHCDLEIEVLPDQYENLAGTNIMTVKSKSDSLTQFTFRLREQFVITSATIGGTPVTVSSPTSTTRVVTLDQTYGMDDVFGLTIVYAGHAESRGFGSIEFTSHGTSDDIVYTLSEPYYSYTWWPVKDGDFGEPGDNGDKFTLDLAVIAPEEMVTASNGLLVGIDDLSLDRKRYRWSSCYPICPYLVCFSSTNYETWSQTYIPLAGGTMPVDFYIYPEDNTGLNQAAWNEVVDMIYTLRDLYGEYPFVDEKYGIYQCEFGGGMEHQTFTAQGGFGEYLTVHELSHQWWGDMITCKTWNHIWLNEGFASYTEALWAENRPGSSGLPALKSYMTGMRYTGSGSVYVTDDELDTLWEIFNGSTSYDKGAWVVHMLRHVLGDADFFDALAAYRAAYEYSAATTEDLQAICEDFYPGGDLNWFFQEWVYGEYVPSYAWGWDSVEVNGQDYLLVYVDQTQSESYQRFTMPIDVVVDGETYVVFNDADSEYFVIPIPSAPSSLSLDPDAWILWGTRTATSYVPGPPTIVDSDPAPGAAVIADAGPDTVAVTFHTNVNTAVSHFSLVGANTGSQPFTIDSTSNVNPVVLDLGAPLGADTYTLTITDGVTASNSGMALDGEITDYSDPGSFPSGDGEPGGEAVIKFTVVGAAIPAVSEWGVMVMALLILAVGTIVFRQTRRVAA